MRELSTGCTQHAADLDTTGLMFSKSSIPDVEFDVEFAIFQDSAIQPGPPAQRVQAKRINLKPTLIVYGTQIKRIRKQRRCIGIITHPLPAATSLDPAACDQMLAARPHVPHFIA